MVKVKKKKKLEKLFSKKQNYQEEVTCKHLTGVSCNCKILFVSCGVFDISITFYLSVIEFPTPTQLDYLL